LTYSASFEVRAEAAQPEALDDRAARLQRRERGVGAAAGRDVGDLHRHADLVVDRRACAASWRDAGVASSGGRRTSNLTWHLAVGEELLLTRSCSALCSWSKSETRSARASACASPPPG
jgi:hypothetical protein